MNENQCRRYDALATRVLDFERQIKQMKNDKTKSGNWGEKDRNLIRQL